MSNEQNPTHANDPKHSTHTVVIYHIISIKLIALRNHTAAYPTTYRPLGNQQYLSLPIMSVSNKRSAEEISLLQGITSTLETNLRGVAPNQNFNSDIDYQDYNDIPLPALPTLKSKSQQSRTIAAPMQSSQQAKSAVDISQTAVKNFLAEKTLIKSITKACVAERVAVGDDSIIEELVTKYKTDYSGLTLKKVVDSITRVTSGNVESGEVSGEKDSNDVATANVETKAAPEEKEEKE
eukprot:scaffold20576_cov80-Skeletonema_marinoi.AAC.3